MNDFSSLLFLCNFVQAVLFWFKSLEQLPYLENMDDAKTKGEKEEKYDFLWFTWLVSFSFASKKYKVSFLKLSPPLLTLFFCVCAEWFIISLNVLKLYHREIVVLLCWVDLWPPFSPCTCTRCIFLRATIGNVRRKPTSCTQLRKEIHV